MEEKEIRSTDETRESSVDKHSNDSTENSIEVENKHSSDNAIEISSEELIELVSQEQPELGNVIRNNPNVERLVKENPELLTLIQVAQVSHHRGPLPRPDILKEYEQALPGLGQTIVNMALEDAEHRRMMDVAILNAKKRDNLLGQVFGFTIGTIAIIAGAVTSTM